MATDSLSVGLLHTHGKACHRGPQTFVQESRNPPLRWAGSGRTFAQGKDSSRAEVYSSAMFHHLKNRPHFSRPPERLSAALRATAGLCFAALVASGTCAWGAETPEVPENKPPAAAATPARQATVWMMPPAGEGGRLIRELFEHPDQWQETRTLVDVLACTDLNLKRHFSDDELRGWFAMMRDWKLKMAMEVGAIKEWGKTGEACFKAERANWEHLQNLGANLYAIAMDEPLNCCRDHLKVPDDYAVEETANYIALVRTAFPDLLIGDIEGYPSIALADHQKWIEALNQKLAARGVRGLDFYRLDVDWLRFNVRGDGSWKEVHQLELWCRQRKLPFSLIYWASGYPSMLRRGLADDSTWYVSTMQQGYDYVAVEGRPDQYVIESWVGAPSRTVPETGDWTFTRSVRDFAKKFAKPSPKQPPAP